MLARIDNGAIVEILSPVEGFPVEECFHPDVIAAAVTVPDTARIGWTLGSDGRTWGAPPLPPPTTADLVAYAASARYARETGGITVGNARIATDRESVGMITGAYSYVQANPGATIDFKTGSGFVSVTAAQVTAIAMAVGAHVQACFAAESQVVAGLNATPPTVTTPAQIDAVFAAISD